MPAARPLGMMVILLTASVSGKTEIGQQVRDRLRGMP